MAKLKMIVVWIVALALLGYVGVCGYLYLQQERFLFHPTKLDPNYQYTFAGPFDEITLAVDGAQINVVRFLANDPTGVGPKGVILYLHGNGDIIPFLEGIAAYFVGLGYDVVIPDYRGYGKSTGQITNEADLHADMEVVYQNVLSEYPEDDVSIYGQSLGTGLSVSLAANHSPKRLILESPYFSMVDLIQTHMPFVPEFLLKYQLRSDLLITQIDCPVHVIHGDQDIVIPFEQGERLYALVENGGEFLHVPGGGHSSLFGDERLRTFLAQLFEADS